MLDNTFFLAKWIDVQTRDKGRPEKKRGGKADDQVYVRKVYVRRGPITVPATPAEIAHLHVERNRVNLTRLEEPLRPVVEDNRIVLLPDTLVPYRIIRKKGYLWTTAQCPVFLPEFSTHISPPRFGGSGFPINAGYHSVRTLTIADFARRVKEVEETVLSMGTYFDALSRFYWSISDDSSLAYGCGVENFLRATKEGRSGVAATVQSGDSAEMIPDAVAWQARVVRKSKDEDAIDEFLKEQDRTLIRQARLSTAYLPPYCPNYW